MATGMEDDRPPGFGSSIRLLPWQAQVGVSALLLVMFVATLAMSTTLQGLLPMLFVLLVVGVPLGLSGLGVRRAQLLEASERARAEAEMDDLRRAVAEAEGRGGVTHRTLSKRGYTSPKIRRWIGLECGVVLPDRDV